MQRPIRGRNFYQRFGDGILLLMILPLPWLAWMAYLSFASASQSVRQWLPRDMEEVEVYDWFVERFGKDEMVVVSWPACRLANPQVDRLAESFVAATGYDQEANPNRYFAHAVTGPQLVRRLTSGEVGLSRAEAIRRLTGTLVGSDGDTTCIILVVSEFGAANRQPAIESIYRIAESQYGLPRDGLHLGGPTVDAATNMAVLRNSLYEMAAWSIVVVILVCWLRLGSVWLTLIVIFTASYSTAATLAVLHVTGGQMNLTLVTVPVLVFVLSTSSSIHLVNYYRQALVHGDVVFAPARAVEHGWRPCLLALGTTAIGMASLTTSKIIPIREFGMYSAVGLMLSAAVLLLILPSALSCCGGLLDSLNAKRRLATLGPDANHTGLKSDRLAGWLAPVVTRRHRLITAGFVAAMLTLGSGLVWLEASLKLQNRFPGNSRIMRDCRWLEANVGPLVPLEVVVRFSESCPMGHLERLQFVNRVQNSIERLDAVDATLSSANFTAPVPDGKGIRQVVQRSILESRLAQQRQRDNTPPFLVSDEHEELWRINVRVNALNDIDYGFFIDEVKENVERLVDESDPQSVKVTYTGAVPLLYRCLRMLLYDLMTSFLLAFGLIAVVFIIILRSPQGGTLAMMPNLFPIIVVFGAMGWLTIYVDSGTMKTASVAIGIAVDGTFHFLTWFRRGVSRGMSRCGSIRFAYSRCAGAMINSTVICAAGLIPFTFSTYIPTVRFAWLMIALLSIALLGDLLFLPALLAGPFARFFVRRQDHAPNESSQMHDFPHGNVAE